MPEDDTPYPTQILKAGDGSTISLAYDPETQDVTFTTHVKIGSYIALGFGKTMTDTNIIQWAAVNGE